MPKLKSRRGVRNRFKKTGTGKMMAYHAGNIHFMRRKRANRKRKLGQKQVLSIGETKKVKRMLPYA